MSHPMGTGHDPWNRPLRCCVLQTLEAAMSDGVAGAGSGERGADATTLVRDEEERKKRLFLWLWFAVGLLLLVLLFVVCAGDGEDEPVALTTTTTTTAAPAAAPAATAPTTASVAPIAIRPLRRHLPPRRLLSRPQPLRPGPSISGEWTFASPRREEPAPVRRMNRWGRKPSRSPGRRHDRRFNGTDPPWQGQIVTTR